MSIWWGITINFKLNYLNWNSRACSFVLISILFLSLFSIIAAAEPSDWKKAPKAYNSQPVPKNKSNLVDDKITIFYKTLALSSGCYDTDNGLNASKKGSVYLKTDNNQVPVFEDTCQVDKKTNKHSVIDYICKKLSGPGVDKPIYTAEPTMLSCTNTLCKQGACQLASCSDSIKNQNEKQVDCGGICKPCPSCTDGIKNQNEQGVDCGGVCGNSCPSCTDNLQNQNEEGVDCGGVCKACNTCPTIDLKPDDQTVVQGEKIIFIGSASDKENDIIDCAWKINGFATTGDVNNACQLTALFNILGQMQIEVSATDGKLGSNNLVCKATDKSIIQVISSQPSQSCTDGIKNQDETGIDCGGKTCKSCPVIPTCSDGIKNQDETGIDCGGKTCKACLVAPTCSDGIKNQDETSIDCGGKTCKACPVIPTCSDGIKNQDETGIDCGGKKCFSCDALKPTCEYVPNTPCLTPDQLNKVFKKMPTNPHSLDVTNTTYLCPNTEYYLPEGIVLLDSSCLFCQGATIKGDGSIPANGMIYNYGQTPFASTISNCIIQDYHNGLNIDFANNYKIINNNFINVDNPIHIYGDDSSNVFIINNKISQCTYGISIAPVWEDGGVTPTYPSKIFVKDNEITECFEGVTLQGSTDSLITNNAIKYNTYGMVLGSKFSNYGENKIKDFSNTIIQNNIIELNDQGVVINQIQNLKFQNNSLLNKDKGIEFSDKPSKSNVFKNNKICSSGMYDLDASFTAASDKAAIVNDNTFQDNTCSKVWDPAVKSKLCTFECS